MLDVVVKHQRAHCERRAGVTNNHTPRRTTEWGGVDHFGRMAEEANVVDRAAVPRGAAREHVRPLSV
jgi:hypothetical protein